MKEINFSFSLVEHIQSFQKKVVALVQSRQMKQAEEVIRSFNPENLLGNRIKEHCRGIYFEYMGDLEMAYSTYLRAIEKYGENVNLYRDLASACYQLDLTAKWRFYHQTLKRRLNEFDEEIGIESKTSCFLLLGKFCEEDGDLRGALNLYEECFESLGSIEDPESRKLLYLKILPQIVRIRAQFNHIDNMGSFYSELISINRVDIPKHLDVEVQHSLMLAEVNLIGPHHAWVRAKLILDDPNVLESDRRLVYFDLLEEMLIRGYPLNDEVLSYQSLCENANAFETEISILVFSKERLRDLSDLSYLASVLSWSCYLRILILYFGRSKDDNLASEIKNKINLILSSLPIEAKSFWLFRMKPYLDSEDFIIRFNKEARSLRFQCKEVDLSRKKGMLLLLEAMIDGPRKSIDEVIRVLWNCDYSPENYHRLRMTVHRLNQILYKLTSIPKVLEISADYLSLKPSIYLKPSEI